MQTCIRELSVVLTSICLYPDLTSHNFGLCARGEAIKNTFGWQATIFRHTKRKKTTTQTSRHLQAVTTRIMADGEKETSFSKLLDAIQETKEDLTKHIDKETADIQTTLTKIESSLSTLAEQVDEIQTRVSANEDDIKDTC